MPQPASKTEPRQSPSRQASLGYLVSQYPTATHTYIAWEIRTLRALGFDVKVVSIRRPEQNPDSLSREQAGELRTTFSVLGGGVARTLGAHLRTALRKPAAYAGSLCFAIRLGGSDLRRITSHGWYFVEAVTAGDYLTRAGVRHFHTHYASTPALIAARLFGLRFSATIHGSGEFDDPAGFHMAEKVDQAVFVAAISRFGSSQIMRGSASRHWSKIHVLPLGVDADALAPRRRAGRNADEPFRILSVGSLVPAKGYGTLLAAVARLIALGRRVELTVVGEGPERGPLEAAIADLRLDGIVRLAGQRNHDSVIQFYREADAFALSSFAEGVPVVLMEAMAMEVPCVATWIAGIPELIRDGVDGLLAAPADPEALADRLARLMDDPALRERLADSARRRVLESYDLRRNSACLAEMFRRYCADL
jgi:colanic acid/amylovoran biosynthesis glycosyltransferase